MSTRFRFTGRIALLLALLLALVLPSLASAAPFPTPYLNGFENTADATPLPTTADADTMFGVTRVASGTNGVTSSDGAWHATAPLNTTSAFLFTRLGGYQSAFPSGGFSVSIDIYLDTAIAGPTSTQLDWSAAISNAAGAHRRDFAFAIGGNGAGGYVMSASNNTPGWPGNPARDPYTITTTGWYTFKHVFRDNAGVLAVDMQVLDAGGTLLKSWTLSDPTDTIGVNVGGNRYAWLVTNEYPDLPIDNVTRSGACTTVCYADAVGGNDADDGMTPATAFKTIQKAIDTVQPGGQVRVLPGNYSETASNRYVQGNGPHVFGLFIDKDDVTVMGVTAADAPITDPTATQARVDTNSTANFGPDGIFVEGDGVTIAGLEIGTNCCGQNKTIEIIGDAFTLKDSFVNDPQGSVYFNDWVASDPSHIQSYTIDHNIFASGVSIDLTSGAGLSGPVSGRQITDNEFELSPGETWPVISFNGSGTGVPWFVGSVGGAVITGNTFHNTNYGAVQWIRARGDYNNAQFDWESYWNDNTYDNAVVFGSNLLTDLGEYSYTSGSYTFNHVRRIGATIQQEVDHATAGDTVLVNEGTYVEQVTVNKDLTLLGEDGKAVTFIQAPATLPNTSTTDSIIVKITGAGVQVEMSEFTVTGPGPGGCGTIAYGIFVRDGAYANIHDNRVVDIRDTGLSGCQNGNAIGVGRQFWSTTGTADITDNEIATYQKTGIIVDNTGSSANITGNTISGEGAISYIAENGIQISRGATAEIEDNTVSGHAYDPETTSSAAMLIWATGTVNTDGNTVSENQMGIWVTDTSGTHQNNTISATAAGSGVNAFWGMVVDAPPPGMEPAPFDGEAAGPGAAAPAPNALAQTVLVTGNTFTSNNSGTGVGLATYGAYGALDIDLTATKNLIHNWATGVEVYECTGGGCTTATFTDVDINRNSIVGNTNGMFADTVDPAETDGTCNWWGDASGPSGAGPGTGDTVSTEVDFTPWLYSSDLDGPCYVGGTIAIDKVATGGGATQFTFDVSWSANHVTLTDAAAPYVTNPPLQAGNYTVAEINLPTGWSLQSATCDNTTTTPVETVNPSSITVADGDAWVCTFTNTYTPPPANTCPVGQASNQWTDLLGIGMGSTKKHKVSAKLTIPNSTNLVDLYGQLVAKNTGAAKYVRFIMKGKNNYVEVNTVTAPADHVSGNFWYGSDLPTAGTTYVTGKWFLQKSGTKTHIPRAFVLYPTYNDPAHTYVNIWETFTPAEGEVYWDVAQGWTPYREIVVPIPAPLGPETFHVELALVDNDKDTRPVWVTVTAGGVTQTVKPTNPDKGDQLNLLVFDLANVPVGTDEIVIQLYSPSPTLDGVDGDSAALVGMTANYQCSPITQP